MKKRLLSVLLITAMSVSLFAGCGLDKKETSNSTANGQVTYTTVLSTPAGDVLPDGQTVEDNLRSQWFTEKTGLVPKVVWSAASGDAFTQKMNMMIASGDIPDYFQVSYDQFEQLVKADLLADLTEYWDLLNPEIKEIYATANNADIEAVTKNGKIYGIPKANGLGDSNPVLYVRKDWLDKLGLEEPTCIEDIAVIAKAFMEQDPDGNGEKDTYGLPILSEYSASSGGTGSVADIFTNYGAATGQWYKYEDGTVIYGSLMEEAKETLELLNSWYEEGIIPKDFASWTEDTYKQSITGGKAGLLLGQWWLSWSYLTDTVVNDPGAEWTAYALPKKSGEDYIGGAPNAAGSAIGVVSKECEDPSIFIEALNDLYDAMCQPTYQQEITEMATVNNSYSPMTIFPLPADAIMMTGVLANKYAAGEITLEQVAEQSVPSEAAYNQGMAEAAKVVVESENPYDSMEDWSNSVGYTVGMQAFYDANAQFMRSAYSGTTETMEKKQTFLDKYEVEEYTKMIMGDTGEQTISEYFDNFVEQYLEQGGAEITKEVQAALDAAK